MTVRRVIRRPTQFLSQMILLLETTKQVVTRTNAIWNSRLSKNWTPRPINEQYNFLDLDCVTDINKAILLWIGNISKQLIDNKIKTTETPR